MNTCGDSPSTSIRIRNLLEQALTHRDSVKAHALLVQARYFAGVDVKRYESARSVSRWLSEIEIYVVGHLHSRINVRELAAITGMNPGHFHRLFVRRFGITPGAYIRARRVQQAQTLMMRVDAKLADVAVQCGFADQSHFSRVFKRVVGDNPRTWRLGYEAWEPSISPQ